MGKPKKDPNIYKSGEEPQAGDLVRGQRGGQYLVEAIGGSDYGPAGSRNGHNLLYLAGGMYPRVGKPDRYTLIRRADGA